MCLIWWGYCESSTVRMFQCCAVDWWSSLSSSTFLKHVEVFRETLAFTLKNNLLWTRNEEVKHLLKVLELLYKVTATLQLWMWLLICVLSKENPRSMFGKHTQCIFLQANKSRKSFKIPLSTFHLQDEEIAHINLPMDFVAWSPKQVATSTTADTRGQQWDCWCRI